MRPSDSLPLPAEDLDKDKKRRRRAARRAKPSSGDPADSGPGQPGKPSNSTCLAARCAPGGAAVGSSNGGLRASGRRWKYYDPHLLEEAVKEGLERGYVFRGSFRVNAYNRAEAYCTVDGLPIDILVNGVAAQNRAVEGDVVAVMLDPVTSWTKLKGSAVHSSDISSQRTREEDVVVANETLCTVPDSLDSLEGLSSAEDGDGIHETISVKESNLIVIAKRPGSSCSGSASHGNSSTLDIQNGISKKSESTMALDRWCAIINSYPSKRPTGKVVSIIEQSHRRSAVVGFLLLQQSQSIIEDYEKQACGLMLKKDQNRGSYYGTDNVIFRPNDPKFPNMFVYTYDLPVSLMERVTKRDPTVEMDLFAVSIENWTEDCLFPRARVIRVLGRGGELKTQIAAIFVENKICDLDFSSESLSCLPVIPWKIPEVEFERRKDLRNLCTLTIDPSSAIDLDDALSVEKISDDVYRVGVHIADVSYFIFPGSALDHEARSRSTSVYVWQHKLPMLPSLLSEQLGSLNPGVDRLAFSLMWDISDTKGIIDQWIGKSVIRSRCKLSYERTQSIIDGLVLSDLNHQPGTALYEVSGQLISEDVLESVKTLHKISRKLNEIRYKSGALRLDNSKFQILFDDYGTPYDGTLSEQKESNSLVEEFMLLANRTVAEVISRTYRECSLLRRHPEPNPRKLKEFKTFCKKLGFELETSSSAQLHSSLSKLKEELKDDPVLFDIVLSYAAKPMQLAMYFCTGDFMDNEDEWAHYALATPCYTHFTSPLRRYPDIVVHRILCAVLKAETMFLQVGRMLATEDYVDRCFTGISFSVKAVESDEGRKVLATAAKEYALPGKEAISEIATHCNNKKLAGRNAEESGRKVYLWAMLRIKESIVCEARVMGLGPKFMSVYIHRFSIERRIHYSDIEGLAVEWLETTSTLVLDLCIDKRSQKKGYHENLYPLGYAAFVMNPTEQIADDYRSMGHNHTTPLVPDAAQNTMVLPAAFPLTLQPFSSVAVVLHAIGGDDGPVDIGVRLYMSSYFGQT